MSQYDLLHSIGVGTGSALLNEYVSGSKSIVVCFKGGQETICNQTGDVEMASSSLATRVQQPVQRFRGSTIGGDNEFTR